MVQADGSVVIVTKMDTSGFKQGEVNVKNSFGKMANAVSKLSSVLRSVFTVKSKDANDLKELAEEIKISVDDTAKSVEDGMQRINDAMSSGADSESFDTIQDKVDALTDHLKLLAEQGLGFGDAEYDAAYQQLVLATDELKQYKSALAEAARAERDTASGAQEASQTVGLFQSVLMAFSAMAHAPVSMVRALGNAIKQLPHATLNLIANGFKMIAKFAGQAAKYVGGKLLSGIKRLGSSMLGLNKSTKGVGNGLKNILKYTLGIGSLLALIKKIKSAAKEGMENLAQYSSETNTHLSALKSSLTQLKNSLATAFNPLLTVIAPTLTKFINLLSQAITYVSMFFAVLTGQKSFTKAVAVQEDYAASLGDTADSAKEAQKYLSGLDEIRTYSEDKDTSAGGNGSVDPSQMFETVDIPGFVGDWVQRFKDAWNNADFSEIGSIVGGKLKSALEIIPWESIKATCNNIAQSLATFINGFVATPGLWETVGVSIGEGVNTAVGMWNTFFDVTNFIAIGGAIATALNYAFQTIDATELGRALSQKIRALIEAAYGFVTEFDWSGFGTWLGEAVNGFFDNIDFALVAQTLSEGIIGALNGITAFIQEVDWCGLGQKVKEFLVNIDWGGICSAMFEAIGAALAGLALFIWGVIEDAWNCVVDWWHDVAFEDGQFTISGLLNGIWEAIKNVGTWIKEHIFDPFINGFKSVFGINSPSTVMAEMGTFLIQGLLNGIAGLISAVKDKFSQIKTIATDVFNSIKIAISDIWNNGIVLTIKNSVNSIIGFINGMISGIVAGINAMINALNSLHFDIPDWIPAIGGKSFGFSIPTITAPQIPYLATGAVIPPNAPFMAVLGDQKHGTNIEAPLSLIEDSVNKAVQNAMSNQQRGGTYIFEAQLDRRTIFRQVIEEAKLRQTVTGRNPFELA